MKRSCSLCGVMVVSLFVCQEALATKTITSSANKNVLKAGDPVSLATGEYFFEQPLLKLGGPIPVGFSFIYGSGLDSKVTRDGLTAKFRGSHGARLIPSPFPNAVNALVDLGLGREVSFTRTNGQWAVFSGESTIWQLLETAGFYYLVDPVEQTVRVFRKRSLPTDLQAFEELMLDRNGNSLRYDWPNPPTLHGPTNVFDGLGRTLRFSYTNVSTLDTNPFLAAVQDHTERRWEFGYDNGPDNNNQVTLRTLTDPTGGIWRFNYQSNGTHWITAVQRPLGNIPFQQGYDTNQFSILSGRGIVRRQTNAVGQVWDFNADFFAPYDERRSSIFSVTNPDGSRMVASHDHTQRMPSRLTDEAGRQILFHSEPERDRIARRIDRKGNIEEYSYHQASGKLEVYRNGLGREFRFVYTAAQQSFTNTLPGAANETVSFTFHDLTRVEYPDGTREEFTYDGRGNIVTARDRSAAVTTFTYNSRGQTLTLSNATGGVIAFTYDAAQNLKAFADGETGVFTNLYDGLNRRVAIQQPDGTTVSYAYDALDRLIGSTDERGVQQEYRLNANGNFTNIVSAAGTPVSQSSRLEYDALDRISKVADGANFETAVSYTYWDALKRFTFSDSTQAGLNYDIRRRPTQIVGEAGDTLNVELDDEARPRSATSAAGRRFQITVDALGYPSSLRDGRGASYSVVRDALQRIVEITDRLGRKAQFAYDGEGRLTRSTLPVIGSMEYTRNGLGLPTQIRDHRGQIWKLGYSPMGRLNRVEDPVTNVWTMAYDSRGRLGTINHPDSIVETYTYDAAGNLQQRSFSDGLTLGFTHDALNRLTATASTPVQLGYDRRNNTTNTTINGRAFGATFDARSRVKTVSYDGQMNVTYTYDARGLVTGISNDLNNAGIALTYDSDDLLMKIQRSNGVATDITRDENGQITRIHHVGKGDLKLSRDAGGQIIRLAGDLPVDVAAFLSNETRARSYDAASQPNAAGFLHDARGRRLKDPERGYRWDSADRLIAITNGATVVTNEYTAMGEVFRETINGVSKEFYYNYAIGGRPIMAERVGGAYRRFYVHTPDGQLLYSVDVPANTPRFYHFNQVGSTLFLTDAAGNVTDSYGYTPYGRRVRHEGTSDQPFTHNGELGVRELAAGSLFHMRARWYDARTARFLTRDPIWLKMIERPTEANPYSFARQNPVSFADPSGLKPYYVDSTGKRVDPDLVPSGTVVGKVDDSGQINWGVVASNDADKDENDDLVFNDDQSSTGSQDVFALKIGAVNRLGLPFEIAKLLKQPVADLPANRNQAADKPPPKDPLAVPGPGALQVDDEDDIDSYCAQDPDCSGTCVTRFFTLNLAQGNAVIGALAARLAPLLVIFLLWAAVRAVVVAASRESAANQDPLALDRAKSAALSRDGATKTTKDAATHGPEQS